MTSSPSDKKLYREGHRERLRRRFREGGLGALADYEILEFVLYRAFPRGDVKPLSKKLLKQFGSFAELVSAPFLKIQEVPGVGIRAAEEIKMLQAALQTFTASRLQKRPLLASWDHLIEHCNLKLGYEPIEMFHVFYLDQKNYLIQEETLQKGTIDRASVYPREIARRSVEIGAKGVIIVHNHPSGNPTPSRADITITSEVQSALRTLGITLHDHVIASKGRYMSLKKMHLLEEQSMGREKVKKRL